MRAYVPELRVEYFTNSDAENLEKREEKEKKLSECDVVFSQPLRSDHFGAFSFNALAGRDNAFFFPPFSFPGFQPDCVYIGIKKALSKTSPVGAYSSSIAVYSYLLGLTPQETLQMYNEVVYEKLGFFDLWENSKNLLLKSFSSLGHDISGEFEEWAKDGVFMHTINHPHVFVLADVAKKLLSKIGITELRQNVLKYVSDHGADDIIWPVYPEIGSRLGISGEMEFKASDRYAPVDLRPQIIDLSTFVQGSFERYDSISRDALICRSTAKSHEESLEIMNEIISDFRREGSSCFNMKGDRSNHPYKKLSKYQFWRKAVASVSARDVDPVVSSDLKISPTDRVATAGSCFAQHIAARLQRNGFGYLVTERAPSTLTEQEAKERNFGVFSARYGNVYTTRQLVQLFDRAMGVFTPDDAVWEHPESGYVDPFRPQIEPRGLRTPEAVVQARVAHLVATRTVFEQADIFVFTLGLTEGWRAKSDGAVFPLAPGVAGGIFDPKRYEFVNFTAQEIFQDIADFVSRIKGVNPGCQVLLTVSPVPLVATYEDRHVLVSTTYSKSALRVAAETACTNLADVHYFPSYEIITGNFNRGSYYGEDMRSIKAEGVDHVMELFFRHLTVGMAAESSLGVQSETTGQRGEPESSFAARMRSLDEVVCDEEALDR